MESRFHPSYIVRGLLRIPSEVRTRDQRTTQEPIDPKPIGPLQAHLIIFEDRNKKPSPSVPSRIFSYALRHYGRFIEDWAPEEIEPLKKPIDITKYQKKPDNLLYPTFS